MANTRRIHDVMGTVADIHVRRCGLDERELTAVVDGCIERLEQIDATFSTYKPDSAVSRIGRGELAIGDAGDDVHFVFDLCEKLLHTTNGYFDVYAAATTSPATELQRSEHSTGTAVEPSGVVKGWAIQQIVDLLHSAGVRDFCVNVGGDLYAGGEYEPGEGWRIGLQHPTERMKVMAVLEVSDAAIATSGHYERGSHIVTPAGEAPDGLISVTVVGADITLADVYATAAFAMGTDGLEWARMQPGFDVFAVDENGLTHSSAGIKRYLAQQ